MLSTAQVAEHLATRRYKPGWRFTVYDGRWEGQHLVITAVLPDAYSEDKVQVIDVHSHLPPMPDTAYLDLWVMDRLKIIETHEMREFWREAETGRPVDDPHAPFAERDNPDYVPPVEVTG